MMIWGVKLKYAITLTIGIIFLIPPMTPIGALIIIGTYMSGMADAKKMDREHAMKMQKARKKFEEGDVEYEVMDMKEHEDAEYPDADEEFDNDRFIKNLRRWK